MNVEPEPMVRLIARDVAMHYGFRTIFRGITLEIRDGEPLAVVGVNGAGKSTLLKILAGVLTPTGGDVNLTVRGKEVPRAERVHVVGLVSPDLALYPQLSALETLAFLSRVRSLPAETDLRATLDRVGLADRATDRVATFSTGMRQRLRIATALLHDPPVLLLDEPGATLDARGRTLVSSLVADSSRAVVVATNVPEEAALCREQVRVG